MYLSIYLYLYIHIYIYTILYTKYYQRMLLAFASGYVPFLPTFQDLESKSGSECPLSVLQWPSSGVQLVDIICHHNSFGTDWNIFK